MAMELPLSLETQTHDDGTHVVVASGDLDRSSAPLFTQCIDAVVAEGGRNVVVDLAQVRFMDSSGLVALMTTSTRLRKAAGGLRVASPSVPVQRLLALTRMDSVFPIFETREAAFGPE